MSQHSSSGRPRSRTGAAAPAKPFHHGNLRQALLEAALAEPDIEGLSLTQLAASVGVTAAAIYRHFASREDLLSDVSRIGFDQLEARFADAFDIASPPAGAVEARTRLTRLAYAYLEFADDEPPLWRLMFGAQGAAYRASARPLSRQSSYDYLPAALLGLRVTGVIGRTPDDRDALFAWSAIHGAATLRLGRVPAALVPLADLAADMAERMIRSMT